MEWVTLLVGLFIGLALGFCLGGLGSKIATVDGMIEMAAGKLKSLGEEAEEGKPVFYSLMVSKGTKGDDDDDNGDEKPDEPPCSCCAMDADLEVIVPKEASPPPVVYPDTDFRYN